MQADVRRDYDWQRPLLPRVKELLGRTLITEAPFEEDACRNTDLIVLRMQSIRIAVRLRRFHPYAQEHPHEFTIRASRPSGAETELAKVRAGWGDYLFYGFSNPHDRLDVAAWVIGDLSVFRAWLEEHDRAGKRAGMALANGDGTRFRAYRVGSLPGSFVLGRVPVTGEMVSRFAGAPRRHPG